MARINNIGLYNRLAIGVVQWRALYNKLATGVVQWRTFTKADPTVGWLQM